MGDRTRLPLPEPDLEIGGKLLPYERRHFHTPGMAAKLGYTEGLQQYFAEPKMHAYAATQNAALLEKVRLLREALVYHQDQTRPIEQTRAALEATA